MSEDIDIKIVSEGPPPRSALPRLRESITGELWKAGFAFDPANPDHRKPKSPTVIGLGLQALIAF